MDDLLDDLLAERHPYTVSQSMGNYGEYEADKAYIKLTTLKKAAILALRNIYKVASHTFHVYLWDLMQGARTNDSHVFTRVKENHNQYLVQAKEADRQGLRLKPHSAKSTLDFLRRRFVKENSDQLIIKWMDILRHSRAPGVSLYEWCNSFAPLIRTYLRVTQGIDLSAEELQRVNKCITAQVTDFELAILAQANDKWKPITLADGSFDLDELKRDVSMADSKFSARKYKPTALILEYLVSRAAKQGVAAPTFVTNKSPPAKKRGTPDDGLKRGTKRFKAGRSRPTYSMEQDTWDDEGDEEADDADWEEDEAADDESSSTWDTLAFQQKATFPPCTTPYCKEKNIAHTHSTDRCYKIHPPKGKGSPSGGRHSLLFVKGKGKSKGKGKGKGKGKQSKGKGNRKGKNNKGKEPRGLGRVFDDTCHFCKQSGHFKAQCPKFLALSTTKSYERIRAKLPNDKVYVYDLLEDSVDAGVCGNCLCCECDWMTCTPPVETLLFHDASRSFVDDGMWDMVSAAKTNNLPLSKEMFLQTQGQAQDCWEDELYADDDHDAEADNSSEEDN